MFDVVSCPKCSGRVTLPEGAGQHGWVRCPICRAEYQAHHLLEFHPPELKLIDEPASPSAGRLPISSADVGDDSDVFTFDDSLLLDEPTGKLPYVDFMKSVEGAAQPAGVAVSEVDFLADDSSEIAGIDRAQSISEIDMRNDETHEPPPLAPAANAPTGDEIRGTETHWSAKTVLDRGAPAPVTSMPAIGLAPRRRSRRRNPIVFVLGIVGGGLLGIPLGYLILLWLPFDPPKDPLRIAPKLPGFILPEALRAGGEERVARFPTDGKTGDGAGTRASAGNNTASDDTAKGNQQGNELAPPLAPFGDSAAETVPSNVEPPSAPPINPLDPTNTQSKATPSATTDQEKDPLADLFGDSTATPTKPDTIDPVINPFDTAATNVKADARSSATENTKSTSGPPQKVPADRVESLGPASEKSYTYQEVLAAVAAAKLTTQQALALPLDAPAAQKKKVNGPFYLNLCKVAEALAFIERSAASELDEKATAAAIEAILNAVPDQRRLEELGKLAGYWYDRPQGNGIVLTGMVKEASPRGKLVESIVETLGANTPQLITVVSPSALTDVPGRPVLVAGAIVNDAAKNLRGYEGTAETVVWAAIAIDPSDRSQ